MIIPSNTSCFEYSIVFNIADNATNSTLSTYELKTTLGIEFMLGCFFIFLILLCFIYVGQLIYGHYAKPLNLSANKKKDEFLSRASK